jgi:hypothetical protein
MSVGLNPIVREPRPDDTGVLGRDFLQKVFPRSFSDTFFDGRDELFGLFLGPSPASNLSRQFPYPAHFAADFHFLIYSISTVAALDYRRR